MAAGTVRAILMAALLAAATALPEEVRSAPVADATEPGIALDLHLEVFVNGEATGLIGAFRREADGRFTADPRELEGVGIRALPQALGPDGRVRLDRLPSVTLAYDEAAQTLSFESADSGRAARVIDAAPVSREALPPSRSSFGALVNYSLLASTQSGGFEELWRLPGVSATLEPRFFGPFGVLDHGMVVSSDEGRFGGVRRLSTTWSSSDVEHMRTWRAGDVVTGGLSWTRPVRLGGLQVQSDFALRPDLVTFPVPSLAGSAAVPSTVEIFVDNARRYSAEVPAGPFEIANLPIVEGGTTARLVVRDAQGLESVTEQAFFASTKLLLPGLLDASLEFGFARRDFGLPSDAYDGRPMGSATLRYGLGDALTIEAHGEGGEGLVNGGAGAVFTLGPFGIGAVSAAGAASDRGTGLQLGGQLELDVGRFVLNARSQRTLGAYDDIASVTADDAALAAAPDLLVSARPPRALDQLALSVPLAFEASSLNLSFTRLEDEFGRGTQIAGLSYSQSLPRDATLFASGFASLDGRDLGLFAGLSIPLGGRLTATASGRRDEAAPVAVLDLSRSPTREVGDHGWRLRGSSDGVGYASGSYNAAFVRLEAGLDSVHGSVRASARAEGAIVAAGGGIHLAHRIDDAFAVVDVGVPGVEVLSENRPVGRTGRTGRLLVADLRSNEDNDLSFDPAALPLDAVIDSTRRTVRPATRSGIAVDFAVGAQGGAALVSFRRPDGAFVSAGSPGRTDGGRDFVVGYDGQAFLGALAATNEAVIEDPEAGPCRARFAYAKGDAEQPMIADVPCEPLTETELQTETRP